MKTKEEENHQLSIEIRWCYLRLTSLTNKRFMKYFFSLCSDFQVFILLNRISCYNNNTCFSFEMRTIDWIEIIIKNRADINVSPRFSVRCSCCCCCCCTFEIVYVCLMKQVIAISGIVYCLLSLVWQEEEKKGTHKEAAGSTKLATSMLNTYSTHIEHRICCTQDDEYKHINWKKNANKNP